MAGNGTNGSSLVKPAKSRSGGTKLIKALFVEPMLLLRTSKLPEGEAWIFEVKLDGYRTLAIKSGGKVQLRSQNNNDFTSRYSAIALALSKLPDETVIDGEVVALDDSYLRQRRGGAEGVPSRRRAGDRPRSQGQENRRCSRPRSRYL